MKRKEAPLLSATTQRATGLEQGTLHLAGVEPVREYNLASLHSMCRGLQYDNVPAGLTQVPSFKSIPYIPIIGAGEYQLLLGAQPEFVGVYLKDVINRSGTKAKKDIKQVLHIPTRTKLVVILHGDDNLLEKFFPNQNRVYKGLACEDVHAVVAPNPSVWKDDSEEIQRINQKYSLISYELIDQAGLATIPHFFLRYGSLDNIRETASWINSRPAVKTIAFNLQTYKHEDDWYRILSALKVLRGKVKDSVQFLIIGPTTYGRIDELAALFGTNMTLLNTSPSLLAWHRKELVRSESGLKEISYKLTNDKQVDMFDDVVKIQTPDLSKIFSANCHAMTEAVVERSLYHTWPNILDEVRLAMGGARNGTVKLSS